MKASKHKLSKKQHDAIAALLVQPTLEAAANIVGVAPSSIYRWLKSADFSKELMAAQRESISGSVRLLQRGMNSSLRVMLESLQSPNDMVRLRAAEFIWDRSLQAMEMMDLAARVEGLEDALNAILAAKGAVASNGHNINVVYQDSSIDSRM